MRASFLKIKEIPFTYYKNHYLHIYFTSSLKIYKVKTNHRRLNRYIGMDEFPKTLYRILDYKFHPLALKLLYQLNHPKSPHDQKVYLQFNGCQIIGRADFNILKSQSKYCLSLTKVKVKDLDNIFNSYPFLSLTSKQVAYSIYDDIYDLALDSSSASLLSIYKKYHLEHPQTYLNEYFKEVIGTTPTTVWLERRLVSFIFHLLNTNESVSQSYYKFGFSNSSHLYKFFKRHFDTTPSIFKKKHLK